MSQISTGRYYILYYPSPDEDPIHVYVKSDGKVYSAPSLPSGMKCVFQLTNSTNPAGVSVEDFQDSGGTITTKPIAPSEGRDSGDWNLSENTTQSNVFVADEVAGSEGALFTLSQVVPDSDYCNLYWTIESTSQEAGLKLKLEDASGGTTQQLTLINISELCTGNFFIFSEDGTCQLYFTQGNGAVICGQVGQLPDDSKKLFLLTSTGNDDYTYQGVLSAGQHSNIAPVLVDDSIWEPCTGQASAASFDCADIQVDVHLDDGGYDFIYEISWTTPSSGETLYLTQSDEFGGAVTLSAKDSKKKQKWKFVMSTGLVDF